MNLKKIIPLAVLGVVVMLAISAQLFLAHSARRSFCRALVSGDTRVVENLLKKYPAMVSLHDLSSGFGNDGFLHGRAASLGWTPLHFAVNTGNTAMMSLLIQYHAPLEAQDSRGLTPLLWTSFTGNTTSAAFLLDHGADINARGRDGRSIMDLSKISMDKNMIALLREHGAKE